MWRSRMICYDRLAPRVTIWHALAGKFQRKRVYLPTWASLARWERLPGYNDHGAQRVWVVKGWGAERVQQ